MAPAARAALALVLASLAFPASAATDHSDGALLGAVQRFTADGAAYLSFDLHPADCDTAPRAAVRFEVTGGGRTRSVGGHDQCQSTEARLVGSGRGWMLETFADDYAYEFYDYSTRRGTRGYSYRFRVGGRVVERGSFRVVSGLRGSRVTGLRRVRAR
ncbi:MAG TPA: hypothetical protein VNB64_08920 [Solirubrobacteraceae bacterium]|nr:hypothetical protein [Solirubrobacteraceae bacterium]